MAASGKASSVEPSPSAVFSTVVGDRGRLLLPAKLRHQAGLDSGVRVSLIAEPGGVRVVPTKDIARVMRGAFRDTAKGKDLVQELLAARRQELEREAPGAKPSRAKRR